MKMVAFGDYMRAHIRESVVLLIIGVLSMYILFALSMPLWQRGMVVAILIFGAYEAISKIQGKPSPTQAIQKAMEETQSSMSKVTDISMPEMAQGFDLPDLNTQMFNAKESMPRVNNLGFKQGPQPEGFGPFKGRRKRR